MVAHRLVTTEVVGSNSGKGEEFELIVTKIRGFKDNHTTGTVQGIQLEGVPTSQKRQVYEAVHEKLPAKVYKNL